MCQVSRGVVEGVNCLVVTVDQVEDFGGRDLVPYLIRGQVHTSSCEDLLKTTDDVLAHIILVGDSADDGVRGISEAQRLVKASAVQVPSGSDVGQELSGYRETSKDNTVRVLRVESGEPVGLDTTEGVTNVDDLVVCAANLWDLALAQLRSDRVESFNFSLSLDPDKKREWSVNYAERVAFPTYSLNGSP